MEYYRVQTSSEGDYRQEVDVYFLEKYGFLYFAGEQNEVYIVSNERKNTDDILANLKIIYKNQVEIKSYDNISNDEFAKKMNKEKLGVFAYFLLNETRVSQSKQLTIDSEVFAELDAVVALNDFKKKMKSLFAYIDRQNQQSAFISKETIFLIFNGNDGTGRKYAIQFLERLLHQSSIVVDGSLFFLPKVENNQFPIALNLYKARPRAKVEFFESLRLKETSNLCVMLADSASEAEEIKCELVQSYYKVEVIDFPKYSFEELVQIASQMLSLRHIKVDDTLLASIIKNDLDCRDTKKIRHLAQSIYHFAIANDYSFSEGSLLDLKLFMKNTVKSEVSTHRAQEKLDDMIGLGKVKSLLAQQLAFSKLQQLRKSQGVNIETAQHHLIFSGNSGTGKTEVARLYTDILYRNNIIRENKLIEVGRAELVGEYIGHTAPKIKRVFDSAAGGVLFIDEAYSLIPESERDFAMEAISTIIQEMENRRDDVLVIFAGYQELMREFIETNPGLQSRIAREIYFEDYSTEELYAIFQLMLQQKSYDCQLVNKDFLLSHFSHMSQKQHFGNARYVRKFLDVVLQQQAMRVMENCDAHSISEAELNLIRESDIRVAIQESLMFDKQVEEIGFRIR